VRIASKRGSVNSLFCGLLVLVAVLMLPTGAHGVLVELGEKDFNNGDTPTAATYALSSLFEAAPFDGVIGGDSVAGGPGSDFSVQWTFGFSALPSVASANLQIGLYDHDSAAAGSQVASFTLDGMDLTTELDALLEGSGGGQLEYNIYDLVLPVSVLSQLHDGNATFELTLAPPGLESNNDATPNNGAGIDFATLSFEAGTPGGGGGGGGSDSIPEPASVTLLALASVIGLRRRRN
jgi:hypothetical protein